MIAAATMATAPSRTFVTVERLAPRSSPNRSHPQKIPTRELAFHNGKAIAKPTSRIANTVNVFATAHRAPASNAHTIRCFFRIRSATTYRVPLSSVGKVQRAVNTPATMHRETANGERPVLTSLVGASAAPSHTPAPRPQRTPRPCRLAVFRDVVACVAVLMWSLEHQFRTGIRKSVQCDQQRDADDKYNDWNQEMKVGEYRFGCGSESTVLTVDLRQETISSCSRASVSVSFLSNCSSNHRITVNPRCCDLQ